MSDSCAGDDFANAVSTARSRALSRVLKTDDRPD
jgi:hypothetical protein